MRIETTIYAPVSLQYTGDVWLRHDDNDSEEATGEANIMFNEHGYYSAYVEAVYTTYAGPFNDYDSASEWLSARGYDDYTSESITLMKQFCSFCDYHTIDGDCVDHEAYFNALLDGTSEPITILASVYNISHALKELDPIAYRCALVDYANDQVTNGEWVEL